MPQDRKIRIAGWLMGLVATVIYLLTLEPDVSFWDCGEFIAVSYGFQVGHPPGAPFYQLMGHLCSLLAWGNPTMVAWWSNALSAVCGGITAMMLVWILGILLRGRRHVLLGAVVGAGCYMVCDTAWFSAVESEVYGMAMAIASATIWAMLRWAVEENRTTAWRWILLTALLLGWGVCVHQLTLLTTPALLLIFILSRRNEWWRLWRVLPLAVLFFAIGLSPYLIIPIRAKVNPPINTGHAYNWERLKRYVNRDQYEKAPVWPRMWRHRGHDDVNYQSWSRSGTNLEYYASYQLWYMYGRYFMWNFSGRYNDRQGYGSMMNGQFITGIPFVDKILVGTSAKMPNSLPREGHNRYFLLPLILGLIGALSHRSYSKSGFWVVMALFLMGGVILNLYLNHPCYEPRERDYAYILSFFAFAIWIGVGACRIADKVDNGAGKLWQRLPLLMIGVPLLMGCQNWDDHDRSGRYIALDTAHNILNNCAEGAILFTAGDNDTFPLWYAQQVEGYRKDVAVYNTILIGGSRAMKREIEHNDGYRPVYFSHYAYDMARKAYPDQLGLVGFTYRLDSEAVADSVFAMEAYDHVMKDLSWHTMEGVYVDEVSGRFVEQYWKDILLIAENLIHKGEKQKAIEMIAKTRSEIPLDKIHDPSILWRMLKITQSATDREYIENRINEELAYYHTIEDSRRMYISYTLLPLQAIADSLSNKTI